MPIPSKGAIITGTTANNTTALPVGTDGQFLMANSACTTGLEWTAGPAWQSEALDIVDGNGSAVSPGTFGCQLYRQTGPNTWDVRISICNDNTAGTGGSGAYCILLPNSLSFDTTQGCGQQPYNGTDGGTLVFRTIPGVVNFRSSTVWNSQISGGVSPFSASGNFGDTSCRYRIAVWNDASSSFNLWASNWYQLNTATLEADYCFTFISA